MQTRNKRLRLREYIRHAKNDSCANEADSAPSRVINLTFKPLNFIMNVHEVKTDGTHKFKIIITIQQ
jgi:hypothetical protein